MCSLCSQALFSQHFSFNKCYFIFFDTIFLWEGKTLFCFLQTPSTFQESKTVGSWDLEWTLQIIHTLGAPDLKCLNLRAELPPTTDVLICGNKNQPVISLKQTTESYDCENLGKQLSYSSHFPVICSVGRDNHSFAILLYLLLYF